MKGIYKYRTELSEDHIPILIKEERPEYLSEMDWDSQFISPDKIAKFMRNAFSAHRLTEEHVWMLCMDSSLHITGIFELSSGAVNWSVLSCREVFMKALLAGAVSIFLVHNHPSQDVIPSKDDLDCTKRIKESGEMLGISLIDHIIVAENNFCSLAEHNVL